MSPPAEYMGLTDGFQFGGMRRAAVALMKQAIGPDWVSGDDSGRFRDQTIHLTICYHLHRRAGCGCRGRRQVPSISPVAHLLPLGGDVKDGHSVGYRTG